MIKRIIAVASIIGIVVCSFATMSMASHTVDETDFANIYNGSYYYDIGWCKVTVYGVDEETSVTVYLKKNGEWQARKQTIVSGTSYGNTVTCYSQSIQGSGATDVSAITVDL